MDELNAILEAALTGFVTGLILAIPVGPVNLTIMNEGARSGFKHTVIIILGALTMETLYCSIAFTGLASLFTGRVIKAIMELITLVFLLGLGIRFLMAKNVQAPTQLGTAGNRIEQQIHERFHPHSAFMTGFVRVLANPGVLVCWIFFAAYFVSRDLVRPNWPGKIACVAGVTIGTALWFFVLGFYASRGRGRFSEKTLLRMEHFSGIALLVMAVIHGGHIVWQMVHHTL
jgi:threonine/homoserine/homoserine lactone efflux protein